MDFKRIVNIRKTRQEKFICNAIAKYPGLAREKAIELSSSERVVEIYKEIAEYCKNREEGKERNALTDSSELLSKVLCCIKQSKEAEPEIQLIETNSTIEGNCLIMIFRYRKPSKKLEKNAISRRIKADGKPINNPVSRESILFDTILECLLKPEYQIVDILPDDTDEVKCRKIKKIFVGETLIKKEKCPSLFEELKKEVEVLKKYFHYEFTKGDNGRTGTEEMCKHIKPAYDWAREHREICDKGPLQFVNDIYGLSLKSERYFKKRLEDDNGL